MATLHPDDFDAFFSALWSKPGSPRRPFQWQHDLARRVLEREDAPWPQAIALPTAAGKTACLDIALFALAAQADRLVGAEPITAPRRIFFVVDRRVIVDEAFERARAIARALREAKGGVLGVVADNLRRIAGATDGYAAVEPLAVHVLRGGMYRSEAWARDPLQPTVVASTVDQLGSRLLFRAYGRGPGMWPVYAGLAANDSLVLLDEAHCARPFLQTLQAVARYRDWAEQPLGRCFHPVVMSATPPPELERFEDGSGEPADPTHPLGRRQLAHKKAVLREVAKAKGARALEPLARALAAAAVELVSAERRAVVVFVNRVATARAVHRLLAAEHGARAVLMTGRMRPIDRDAVLRELDALASSRSEDRVLDEPRFVVATQTLEVGADLDFDALVTECASLDALRQRFGRLNRMGRPIDARAAVLVRADQSGNSDDDPVYGSALAGTWRWLNERADPAGEVDFGIAHLAPLLPSAGALAALNAPSPDAAVMLPAHVDCWAQTAPVPEPSPDVAVFLRGPREGPADVRVCWRMDIALESDEEVDRVLDSLTLCPPSSAECVPVPVGLLKRWMAGETVSDHSSDVEGAEPDVETEAAESPLRQRRVVRWRGRDTTREDVADNPGTVRPGDVLVIPVATGGMADLADLPGGMSDGPARVDAGDQAYLATRAKALLRLHPRLVEAWPACEGRDLALAMLDELDEGLADDTEVLEQAVARVLETLSQASDDLGEPWRWLTIAAQALKDDRGKQLRVLGGMVVLVGQRLLAKRLLGADSFSDEDDFSASGTSRRSGTPVRLQEHLPGVAGFARRFAAGCGLGPELVEALERAGLLHDLGKADPRFQALLNGGNPWAIGVPLAKSAAMPKSRAAAEAARLAAGYPPGARHELLSVRLAESAPGLLPADRDLRDLVLHLVASHHGHCRPFAPVVLDDEPPQVRFELDGVEVAWQGRTGLERLDSGVSERFWRLLRRYGWWGLAWLEALLRLADHRRSEWEQVQ